MYTQELFKEGITYLGITSPGEVLLIQDSIHENRQWLTELERQLALEVEWENRYKIPKGLTKKALTELQKETQKKFDTLKVMTRDPKINVITKMYLEMQMEEWKDKKERIKKTLALHKGFKKDELDIKKAKDYPIDQLLEFKARYARCIMHDEKTPSLYLYKERNKAHCFSCHGDFDSIDIFMKINNVTLPEAVKHLCQTH